jgi:hypothetical protein
VARSARTDAENAGVVHGPEVHQTIARACAPEKVLPSLRMLNPQALVLLNAPAQQHGREAVVFRWEAEAVILRPSRTSGARRRRFRIQQPLSHLCLCLLALPDDLYRNGTGHDRSGPVFRLELPGRATPCLACHSGPFLLASGAAADPTVPRAKSRSGHAGFRAGRVARQKADPRFSSSWLNKSSYAGAAPLVGIGYDQPRPSSPELRKRHRSHVPSRR